MSQEREIEKVIKNIRLGLKKYTKEFDDAAERFLKSKEKIHAPEIEYVLQVVCIHYKLKRHQLVHSEARGAIQDAKRMAYCLLHFKLELPVRYIAQRVFFVSHGAIFQGVKVFKNLNPKIKTDKEFMDIYEKLQGKINKA